MVHSLGVGDREQQVVEAVLETVVMVVENLGIGTMVSGTDLHTAEKGWAAGHLKGENKIKRY